MLPGNQETGGAKIRFLPFRKGVLPEYEFFAILLKFLKELRLL